MHFLTYTRAVSNATLSSEDENERDLTRPSVPPGGCLVRPASWTLDLLSMVHPYQPDKPGLEINNSNIPHGTVNADPSVNAELATCGCGTMALAKVDRVPIPRVDRPE